MSAHLSCHRLKLLSLVGPVGNNALQAAGVAHEINTPLAYVKNSLGAVAGKLPAISDTVTHGEKLLALLQAGSAANPQDLAREFAKVSGLIGQLQQQKVVEELIGLVNDGLFGTSQMTEIVSNLKDFSRLDRSKVTSFNLNDGLARTLMLAKHLLKSVSVERKLGEIPAIVCSPSQINQVFLNLVTNAAQAMEGTQGKITLTTRAQDDGVLVEVADTGKGIAPENLQKIFDPFFSTKEIGKGTGLGLSVVHGIVTAHGGAITVESQPGQGATFALYLPPASQPASVPAEASRAAASPEIAPDSGPRILYIDDNTEMVSMVRRLLERQGYRISAHTDARTAVGLLRADPAAFDLVLTDYNMPGMSGLDIAETVRSLRADLPVAVTSGFIDETLQAKAVAAGVCELIFKADTVQAFCDAVQRLTQKLVR